MLYTFMRYYLLNCISYLFLISIEKICDDEKLQELQHSVAFLIWMGIPC